MFPRVYESQTDIRALVDLYHRKRYRLLFEYVPVISNFISHHNFADQNIINKFKVPYTAYTELLMCLLVDAGSQSD